jgi:hypothetical protein
MRLPKGAKNIISIYSKELKLRIEIQKDPDIVSNN